MHSKIRQHKWSVVTVVLITIIILTTLIQHTPNQVLQQKKKGQKKEMEVAVEFDSSDNKTTSKANKKIQNTLSPNTANNNIQNFGAFPPIRVNYRTHLGFKKYAEYMIKLGGIFILFARNSHSYYQIDFFNNRLRNLTLQQLQDGNYSPRTRLISDEPYITKFLQGKRVKSGEVLLILPQKIENYIITETVKYCNIKKISLHRVSSFEGFYHISEGMMALTVNKAVENNIPRNTNLEIRFAKK